MKHLEYDDRYNVGLKRGQIENHQWAFDWPMYFNTKRLGTGLNWPKSPKLHAKYCENVFGYCKSN